MTKCPDANEIHRKQGPDALRQAIDDALPLRRARKTERSQTNGHADDDALFDKIPSDPPETAEPIGDAPELGNDEAAGKQSEPGKVYWHGDVDYRASRPYLVQDVIPEIGHGLIAGQWGTFKTFAAFDLAHACMSGAPWLGYEIMRRGGVLFVALEGSDEVRIRLQAVIEDRGKITGKARFAWIETCPPLIGTNAADEICAIAEPVAGELKTRFCMPLVLIVIDTIIAGAGYTRDGQENDAAGL